MHRVLNWYALIKDKIKDNAWIAGSSKKEIISNKSRQDKMQSRKKTQNIKDAGMKIQRILTIDQLSNRNEKKKACHSTNITEFKRL